VFCLADDAAGLFGCFNCKVWLLAGGGTFLIVLFCSFSTQVPEKFDFDCWPNELPGARQISVQATIVNAHLVTVIDSSLFMV